MALIKQNHIIQKLTIEFELDNKADFHPMADKISQIVREVLKRKLAKILDELDDPDRVIRLDKLEIDLENFSQDDLEQKLTNNLLYEFKKKLKRAIEKATPTNFTRPFVSQYNQGNLGSAGVPINFSNPVQAPMRGKPFSSQPIKPTVKTINTQKPTIPSKPITSPAPNIPKTVSPTSLPIPKSDLKKSSQSVPLAHQPENQTPKKAPKNDEKNPQLNKKATPVKRNIPSFLERRNLITPSESPSPKKPSPSPYKPSVTPNIEKKEGIENTDTENQPAANTPSPLSYPASTPPLNVEGKSEMTDHPKEAIEKGNTALSKEESKKERPQKSRKQKRKIAELHEIRQAPIKSSEPPPPDHPTHKTVKKGPYFMGKNQETPSTINSPNIPFQGAAPENRNVPVYQAVYSHQIDGLLYFLKTGRLPDWFHLGDYTLDEVMVGLLNEFPQVLAPRLREINEQEAVKMRLQEQFLPETIEVISAVAAIEVSPEMEGVEIIFNPRERASISPYDQAKIEADFLHALFVEGKVPWWDVNVESETVEDILMSGVGFHFFKTVLTETTFQSQTPQVITHILRELTEQEITAVFKQYQGKDYENNTVLFALLELVATQTYSFKEAFQEVLKTLKQNIEPSKPSPSKSESSRASSLAEITLTPYETVVHFLDHASLPISIGAYELKDFERDLMIVFNEFTQDIIEKFKATPPKVFLSNKALGRINPLVYEHLIKKMQPISATTLIQYAKVIEGLKTANIEQHIVWLHLISYAATTASSQINEVHYITHFVQLVVQQKGGDPVVVIERLQEALGNKTTSSEMRKALTAHLETVKKEVKTTTETKEMIFNPKVKASLSPYNQAKIERDFLLSLFVEGNMPWWDINVGSEKVEDILMSKTGFQFFKFILTESTYKNRAVPIIKNILQELSENELNAIFRQYKSKDYVPDTMLFSVLKMVETQRLSVKNAFQELMKKIESGEQSEIISSEKKPLSALEVVFYFLDYASLPPAAAGYGLKDFEKDFLAILKEFPKKLIDKIKGTPRDAILQNKALGEMNRAVYETLAKKLQPVRGTSLIRYFKVVHSLEIAYIENYRAALHLILYASKTPPEKINGEHYIKDFIKLVVRENISNPILTIEKIQEGLRNKSTFAETRKALIGHLEVIKNKTRVAKSLKHQAQKSKSKTERTSVPYPYKDGGLNEAIYIRNAGLVLMWPFLPHYFGRLNMLNEDNSFKTPELASRAVHLLQYLATKHPGSDEHELMLNKILCGLPIDTPVEYGIYLTEEEVDLSESLLRAVIKQWKAMGNSSIDGLRGGFLIRDGRLEKKKDGKWRLQVEKKPYDILLGKLPWSYSMVKVSWMPKRLIVEWG